MPHTGRQINVKQGLALGHHAGWRGNDLTIAVATMSREGARFIGAWHANINEHGHIVSFDRGLWQINTNSGLPNDQDAFCPITNVEQAYRLWKARGFSPWMAYTSGAYEDAMEYTDKVRRAHEWESIDVTNVRLFPCCPVPQELLDWRAEQAG